jgi:hypothetical protein
MLLSEVQRGTWLASLLSSCPLWASWFSSALLHTLKGTVHLLHWTQMLAPKSCTHHQLVCHGRARLSINEASRGAFLRASGCVTSHGSYPCRLCDLSDSSAYGVCGHTHYVVHSAPG